MSVELGSTNLTDIQNPVIGPQIEENFKGSTLDTIMSELVKENDFSKFNNQGVRFESDRAKNISSTGADISADMLSFDKDSYFLEIEGIRGREKFYVVEAREGLIVTSERDGVGFIGPESSLGWAVEDQNFSDIEKILRGEFDLTDRTHSIESEEEIFQVPSYSSILEETGDLPEEMRDSLLEIGNEEHLEYNEEEENGVGFWTDGEHGFKGRNEEGKIIVENFQELDYSINLDEIDPQNSHLDITDFNDYKDVDFDLFTESILEMATEEEEGLVQDWDSETGQNVLAYKQNSNDSEMTVLGIGNQNLEFAEGVKEYIEEVLSEGNHTSDLMARLGRILENPLRDDRFEGNELGYWQVADDLRLYTVTPENDNTTYLAFAGSHEEAKKRFYGTNNPNKIKENLMNRYVGDEFVHHAEGYQAAHPNISSILVDAGHSRENAYKVSQFVERRLRDAEITPSPTEFYNLENRYMDDSDLTDAEMDVVMGLDRHKDASVEDSSFIEGRVVFNDDDERPEQGYDRIDIDVEGSIEDLDRYGDDELLSSLDPDAEYNEIHLNKDLSLNLRFRDEDEKPSLDL